LPVAPHRASGFTTRSDIGPARVQAEAGAEGEAANGGRGEEIIKDPDQFQDPEDESNIFAGTVYEQDDEEADRVWESVDERLDERRKRRREETEAEQLKAFRAAQPKIQTQYVWAVASQPYPLSQEADVLTVTRFADLKRGLGAVTDAEWENLPDVSNMTGKKTKRNPRMEREYAMPDSVALGNLAQSQTEGVLSEEQMVRLLGLTIGARPPC
jgi:pre-mRNA-processing factor 6